MPEAPVRLQKISVNDCACVCSLGMFDMYITALLRLSMDLASDSEKAEEWDSVSVTHAVNNPSTPLVLSFHAKDSRPLQCQQEMALFYGIEMKDKKRSQAEWEERGKEDGAKKGPSGNVV